MSYTWHDQLDVGARGEAIVFQWLRQQENEGLTDTVVDFTEIKFWQDRGIDGASRKWGHFDIKTDEFDNTRAFLELYNRKWQPGALLKTRADWWFYYKPRLRKIIAFKPAEVVGLVLYDVLHYDMGANFLKTVKNGDRDAARGIVMDISEIIVNCPSTLVWELPNDATDADNAPGVSGRSAAV